MKKFILSSLFFLLVGTILPALGEVDSASQAKIAKLAASNNDFALELYARLGSREGNIFFSPYSLSSALAMVYGGARGATEKEMTRVLHFAPEQENFHPAFFYLTQDLLGKKEAVELFSANALWGQKGYEFLPAYLALVKKYYGAAPYDVDFIKNTEGARVKINTWTEEQTKNKIRELLKPGILQPLTRLVLTDAIYFNGKWATAFKKEATRKDSFTLPSGFKISVPMMNQEGIFPYFEDEAFQAISLPYGRGEFSMFILLPRKEDGLPDLEESLPRKFIMLPFLCRKVKVRLFLPKFTMEGELSLAGTLQSMGMKTAFSPEADFSGMTQRKELFISEVIHKAFVDVQEEGTEAAAATAIAAMPVGIEAPVREEISRLFRADHPFLFFIRHNPSGSILFMGRLENPKI